MYVRVPNGESYQDLYDRAVSMLNEVIARGRDAVLVTHSGIIRALLAHATNTPLEESFERRTEYGRLACLEAKNGVLNILFFNA